jgi:hypothetical protein
VILGGSPSQLLLRHVTSARPFSIKVDTSSPINITVGDERDVAIELIASGDRSVVDSAVLAGSAILVTKETNSGLELGSLFYRGSNANYKLRQVRAENVSLHFEDLGLGGILATYYRDAQFSAPFASGVQEQPLLRAQSNIISHSNSFRWTWLMRASVNAGYAQASAVFAKVIYSVQICFQGAYRPTRLAERLADSLGLFFVRNVFEITFFYWF